MLSWGEGPTRVLLSQFTGVAAFMEDSFQMLRVVNVSFISLRGYWTNRRKFPKSTIVMPMIFGNRLHTLYHILFSFPYRFLSNREYIFWCRGAVAFYVFSNNWNTDRCIYDARGAHLFEAVSLGKDVKRNFKFEYKAFSKAKKVIVVSEKLIEYSQLFYGIDISFKTQIIPCCNAETRGGLTTGTVSFKWPFDNVNSCVGVYIGSNANWQFATYYKDMIRSFLDSAKENCYLHLGAHTDFTKGLLKDYGKRVHVGVIQFKDVNSVLSRCDYAFMVREDNWVNRVASPVKVAEYLRAGLPVILSSNIGDTSKWLVSNNLGLEVTRSARTYTLESSKKSFNFCDLNSLKFKLDLNDRDLFEYYYDRNTYINNYKKLLHGI